MALKKSQSLIAQRTAAQRKNAGYYLRNVLKGLKAKAAAQKTKPAAQEPEIVPQQTTIQTNPIITFVKNVTVTITQAINTVISTVTGYINSYFVNPK